MYPAGRPLVYEVRLSPAAARQLKKLPSDRREVVRAALRETATLAAAQDKGLRGGKSVKSIRGRRDNFYRLRVGDFRVMYDLIDEEAVLLVLGIVHRRDLERWLRSR